MNESGSSVSSQSSRCSSRCTDERTLSFQAQQIVATINCVRVIHPSNLFPEWNQVLKPIVTKDDGVVGVTDLLF